MNATCLQPENEHFNQIVYAVFHLYNTSDEVIFLRIRSTLNKYLAHGYALRDAINRQSVDNTLNGSHTDITDTIKNKTILANFRTVLNRACSQICLRITASYKPTDILVGISENYRVIFAEMSDSGGKYRSYLVISGYFWPYS